jgi:hypothetical protein
MVERLEEVAEFAVDCRRGCPAAYAVDLAKISDAFAKNAQRLRGAA